MGERIKDMNSIRKTGLVIFPIFIILLGWGLGSASSADWSVSMKVLLNEAPLTPLPLEFGIKEGATDLYDQGLDGIVPPSTPEGDDAYFVSIVNEESPYNKLLKDLRGQGGGSINWWLVLRMAPGKNIKLDWSGSILPAGIFLGVQEADGKWNGIGPIGSLSTGPQYLQWTNTTDQLQTKRLILLKY
jgi:hypothetical protein